MTAIKSYTDLEQSRKLAEILPAESANMYYTPPLVKGHTTYIPHLKRRLPIDLDIEQAIPCWSLAALLDILPILDNRSPVISKTFDGTYRVLYHSTAYESAILTSDYGNPIDACYEMILKLNELKML